MVELAPGTQVRVRLPSTPQVRIEQPAPTSTRLYSPSVAWRAALAAEAEAREQADTDEAEARQAADEALTPAGLTDWPLTLYGNSYALLSLPSFTAGEHYAQQVAEAEGGGTVTSYGQAGRRIFEAVFAAINSTTPFPGATAPVSGARWPGVSARPGPVIIDTLVNDVAHGPTSGNTPTALNANNRYRDSVAAAYRTMLALASGETRVEQTAFVSPTDAWTVSAGSHWSAGSSYVTTIVGRRLTYSLTPPQSGPLAGKVFLVIYRTDPAVLTTADVTIAIDGGSPVATPVGQWEQYTGNSGAAVNYAPHVISVTLPIDNAAHTVTIAHAGSAGESVVTDFANVPSETPAPIFVMEPPFPVASLSGWTAGAISHWNANYTAIIPAVKAVVAEFPNAIWVPSTVTANGMYSGDGIHLNDRGAAQRARDLRQAFRSYAQARLEARALAQLPDASFGII